LFPHRFLFLQIGFDGFGMLQNVSDQLINPCEKTDGRKCVKKRFRRFPTPKSVNENVEMDSRANDVVLAITDLQNVRWAANQASFGFFL
jgi:hypothetical protein